MKKSLLNLAGFALAIYVAGALLLAIVVSVPITLCLLPFLWAFSAIKEELTNKVEENNIVNSL